MKLHRNGRRVYLVQYTTQELAKLQEALTWFTDRAKTETYSILFQDDSERYYFYYGLVPVLEHQHNLVFEIENQTEDIIDSCELGENVLENITLYDFQVSVARKSISLRNGLSVVVTGGGKTIIMLAVLRNLLDTGRINKALVVVPSVNLAEQMSERGYNCGFTRDEILPFHGHAKDISSRILVGVINSLARGVDKDGSAVLDFLQDVDCILFDEAHHTGAATYRKVLDATQDLKYCLGYSGSPFREEDVLSNPTDALLMGIMGRVIAQIGYKPIMELGLISEPLVHYHKVPGQMLKYLGRFDKIYSNFIVNNVKRNEAITHYAQRFVANGFPTLILTQRIEHLKILLRSLKGLRVLGLSGGSTGYVLDEAGGVDEFTSDYTTFRDNFQAGLYDVVIMSQVGDEGVDIPAVGALILAGGGKGRIKNLQRLGRGLRSKKVMNRVYVVDFYDRTHVYLASHSKKRKALFEEAGATMVDNVHEFANEILKHAQLLREANAVV